jgi:hypothetical protein
MDANAKAKSRLDAEACEWLARVLDEGFDPEDPIPSPAHRQAALCRWLSASPRHIEVFMEALQLYLGLEGLFPESGAQVAVMHLHRDGCNITHLGSRLPKGSPSLVLSRQVSNDLLRVSARRPARRPRH